MNAPDRLTFLTTRFYRLQTLRFAPLFVLFIAISITHPLEAAWSSRTDGIALVAGILFCIAWYLLLNRYYVSHFGRIEPQAQFDRRFGLSYLILGLLPIYTIIRGRHVPVEVGFLMAAAYILGEALYRPSPSTRRWIYIASSTIWLIYLVPAFVLERHPNHSRRVVGGILFGLSFLILAIVDHITLVRLCGPNQEVPDA
jgi:hypothetical protein